eukprot:17418-Amphidinium_carterae.1
MEEEMSEIGFREMDRCGRNDLYKLDLFKHCSDAFRTAVGDVSLPKLFASGVEIIAEGAECATETAQRPRKGQFHWGIWTLSQFFNSVIGDIGGGNIVPHL